MLIAYWNESGIEIYRLKDGRKVKFASGKLDSLKPVKSFGKKALVVGKDLLLHTRKRYPPASEKDIKTAVHTEMNDLFPLTNPYHFSRIFEAADTYTLVDIWAWEGGEMEKLRAVFPFTHVVPEDMTFFSDSPEITVLGMGDTSYLIAHSGKGPLGLSTVKGEVTRGKIDLFSKGVSRYSGEIKRINLRNAELKGFEPGDVSIEVVSFGKSDFPPCIDMLARLDLRDFRTKTSTSFFARPEPLLRGAIYLLLAYSLALYMTDRNYTRSLAEVNSGLKKLAGELKSMSKAPGEKEGYADIVRALNKNLKEGVSPLAVMDLLAGALPAKAHVTRLLINEKSLSLNVSSQEPLDVIRALDGVKMITNVKVKGTLGKDPGGQYSLGLQADLK